MGHPAHGPRVSARTPSATEHTSSVSNSAGAGFLNRSRLLAISLLSILPIIGAGCEPGRLYLTTERESTTTGSSATTTTSDSEAPTTGDSAATTTGDSAATTNDDESPIDGPEPGDSGENQSGEGGNGTTGGDDGPHDDPGPEYDPDDFYPPCLYRGGCVPLCRENSQLCFSCEHSADCRIPFPHCDGAQASCVECLNAEHCIESFGPRFPACSAGRCVECQGDRDCPFNRSCYFGRCGECKRNDECRPGDICLDFSCVPSPNP